MQKYEKGRNAKDIITGFAGMIEGYCTYLTGCDQYLLSPKVDKEGKAVESAWFDENRIKYTDNKKAIDLDPKKEMTK